MRSRARSASEIAPALAWGSRPVSLEHQLAHLDQVVDRRLVAALGQPLAGDVPLRLGCLAEREQRLVAAGGGARDRDLEHLLGRQERRLQPLRRLRERAVLAAVAAQLRERDEHLRRERHPGAERLVAARGGVRAAAPTAPARESSVAATSVRCGVIAQTSMTCDARNAAAVAGDSAGLRRHFAAALHIASMTRFSSHANLLDMTIANGYRALADPSRREILRLLREGDLPAGELASQFEISWPSVSRHLRVLEEAGLVRVQAQWRQHHLRAADVGAAGHRRRAGRPDRGRPVRPRPASGRRRRAGRNERDRDDRQARPGLQGAVARQAGGDRRDHRLELVAVGDRGAEHPADARGADPRPQAAVAAGVPDQHCRPAGVLPLGPAGRRRRS